MTVVKLREISSPVVELPGKTLTFVEAVAALRTFFHVAIVV